MKDGNGGLTGNPVGFIRDRTGFKQTADQQTQEAVSGQKIYGLCKPAFFCVMRHNSALQQRAGKGSGSFLQSQYGVSVDCLQLLQWRSFGCVSGIDTP